MFPINLKDWASVHVSYNDWDHLLAEKNNTILKLENFWKNFFLKETSNGKLFLKNNFFKQLKQDTILLAHLTPNLHNILKNNIIYPSGGCLVGSIYCVPVSKTKQGLRLHNLGSFIFNKEVPCIAKVTPHILLIEIKLPRLCKNRLLGINYLQLGSIHFNLFKELEYLLSKEERHTIKKICVSKVQGLLPLLNLVQEKILEKKINIDLFFSLFYEQIKYNPILAYILFEAFCEFVILYQQNNSSEKWKEQGEIYSWNFKNSTLSFSSNPYFNLRNFQPNIETIYKYLKETKCINKIKFNQVKEFLFNRIVFLIYSKLYNHNYLTKENEESKSEFENLSRSFGPLIGHTIHRELRNFGRYPNFYYYFDQLKALQVWNYWNYTNIVIPFNGISPKGEVGINPAFPNLEFKVFTTKAIIKKEDEVFIQPEKEIKINFVPRLIDLRFTTLRNKQHVSNN